MNYKNIKIEAENLAKIQEQAYKTINKVREGLNNDDKEIFDKEMSQKIKDIPVVVEEIKPQIFEMIKSKLKR